MRLQYGKKADPKLIKSMFDKMDSARGNWKSLWDDCRKYCRPVKGSIYGNNTPGEDRSSDLYDSTSVVSVERFASGLYGYMCRHDDQWFRITSINRKIMESPECREWFYQVEKIIFKNLCLGSFFQAIHESFLDFGTYGMAMMYIEDSKEYAVKFKNISIQNYVIEENADGVIDTVIVKMRMTLKQMVQKFGIERLSEKMQKECLKNTADSMEKKYDIYHAVCPRVGRRNSEIGKLNMPFGSVFVEGETNHVISEGGYESLPYIAGRFIKDPDEVYGRSPAINCLSDIKMLNALSCIFLKSEEKNLNPPMLVAHNSIVNKPNFSAGRIIYVRGSVFQDRPVPLQSGRDPNVGMDMLQRYESKIKEAFYTDMFDYLMGGKYMTTVEVEARKQTKLFLFAPLLARIQKEFLSRIIERCFDIMFRKGLFPEVPEEIKKNPDYEVNFAGRMANALKSIEYSAVNNVLMMLAPVMQYDPNVAKNFDWNEIIRDTGLNQGMPVSYVRDRDEVKAEIQAEQEMLMQQHDAQMAQQNAKTAKELNEPVKPGSMLEEVASGGE